MLGYLSYSNKERPAEWRFQKDRKTYLQMDSKMFKRILRSSFVKCAYMKVCLF